MLLALSSVFAFDDTKPPHGIKDYDTYAQNLLTTGIYGLARGVPDATIPPLYAYSLAGVYAIFGRGYWQVGAWNTILDALTVILVYHIGKRLLPHGHKVGLLAGLCFALYPYAVFQTLTVIDTSLFTMLLHAFVLSMILLRDRPTFNRNTALLAISGGVILGLTALSRAIIAPLALFIALWFLFRLKLWQTAIRLVPVAVVSVIVLIPWTLRNYNVYHSFVAVSNNSGMNFWFGNNRYTIPYFRAGYHTQWATPDEDLSKMTLRDADAELFRLGVQYLRDHPGQIPQLLWVKFLAYWSIDIFPRNNPGSGTKLILNEDGSQVTIASVSPDDPVTVYAQPIFDQVGRVIHLFYFGSLLVLAIAGIALSVRRWREVSLLWFVQISMTAVYVIIVPATRYRAPTDPLLFLFSAYTLVVIGLWLTVRANRSNNLSEPPKPETLPAPLEISTLLHISTTLS